MNRAATPKPAFALPIAAQSQIPARLGPYEVCAKIGEGGMATLYLGKATNVPSETDALTDRAASRPVVALKVIRDGLLLDRVLLDMFIDEARIASSLTHPNIVTIFALGLEGTRAFLAMELLRGKSLWHVDDTSRARGDRIPYDIVAWIGARLASALAYAHASVDASGHSLEIVHRDVNPTNVFLTYDGEVKLVDFGLAKARNRISKTAAGIIKGKVAYMSPEQGRGAAVDGSTDVFALAITLWEIGTARRLFKGSDDVDTLKRVQACEVPDPTTIAPNFPRALADLLSRALSAQPEQRPTARAFANELDRIARVENASIGTPRIALWMESMFHADRTREATWVDEASDARRDRFVATLNPPSPGVVLEPSLLQPPLLQSAVAHLPSLPRTDTRRDVVANESNESGVPSRWPLIALAVGIGIAAGVCALVVVQFFR